MFFLLTLRECTFLITSAVGTFLAIGISNVVFCFAFVRTCLQIDETSLYLLPIFLIKMLHCVFILRFYSSTNLAADPDLLFGGQFKENRGALLWLWADYNPRIKSSQFPAEMNVEFTKHINLELVAINWRHLLGFHWKVPWIGGPHRPISLYDTFDLG